MTNPRLVRYTDNDWIGFIDIIKRTLGYARTLGSKFLSYASKKQDSMAIISKNWVCSSNKFSNQAIGLRKILQDMYEQQENQ